MSDKIVRVQCCGSGGGTWLLARQVYEAFPKHLFSLVKLGLRSASQPCASTPLQGCGCTEDDVNRLRGSPPTSLSSWPNKPTCSQALEWCNFPYQHKLINFCGSRELLLSQDFKFLTSRQDGCSRSPPSFPPPNCRPLFLRRPIDFGHRAGHDRRALRESWQCIQA